MNNNLQRNYTIAYSLLGILWMVLLPWKPFEYSFMLRPLSSILLVYIAHKYTSKGFGKIIFLGILFGLAGDYFLAPSSENFFIFGLVAFLIGHIFYIIAFLKEGIKTEKWKWIVLFILFAYSIFMIIIMVKRILFLNKPIMIAPIILYLIIICTMAATAVLRKQKNNYIIFGAFIFVASDSLLALNYILSDIASIKVLFLGVFTYILGQYLIVFGAVKENNYLNKNTTL